MVFGKRRVIQLLSLIVAVSVGMPVRAAFAFGFVPPPDNETPRQTSAGGAARGNNCSSNSPIVNATSTQMTETMPSVMPVETMPVAMLPEGNYGKTLQSHPTFLIYVPPSDIDGLLFVLKNEAGNILYAQDVALTDSSSIISLTLPEDAPSLAVNQNYRWQVAFKCNGLISPNSHFIQGWVERAEIPTGLTAVNPETAFDQAEYLSNAGIWYDSVSTLATLVYPDADSLSEPSLQASSTMIDSWTEFLSSVGLEGFSSVPVVWPQ